MSRPQKPPKIALQVYTEPLSAEGLAETVLEGIRDTRTPAMLDFLQTLIMQLLVGFQVDSITSLDMINDFVASVSPFKSKGKYASPLEVLATRAADRLGMKLVPKESVLQPASGRNTAAGATGEEIAKAEMYLGRSVRPCGCEYVGSHRVKQCAEHVELDRRVQAMEADLGLKLDERGVIPLPIDIILKVYDLARRVRLPGRKVAAGKAVKAGKAAAGEAASKKAVKTP